MTNHTVGRIQDILGGAVILLEFDHRSIRKDPLKIQDIVNIGPPEFIDRLVVISDHTKILVFFCQKAHQLKLYRVGILIFIHQYIPKTLLIIV